MGQNFTTSMSDVQDSDDLNGAPAPPDFEEAGREAAVAIIDSGVLGEGPYSVNVSGSFEPGGGGTNTLTVSVSCHHPIKPIGEPPA